jgi:hypothetical protein
MAKHVRMSGQFKTGKQAGADNNFVNRTFG